MRKAFIFGSNGKVYRELNFAESDAKQIKEVLQLKNCGFTIDFVSAKENRAEVIRRWKYFLSRCNIKDEVIFYYAGHGYLSRKELYLVPNDAQSDETEKSIRFSDIADELNETRLENKLIILDCCYAGGGTQSIDFESLEQKYTTKNYQFLVAAAPYLETLEASKYKGGFLTQAVINALTKSRSTLSVNQLFQQIQPIYEQYKIGFPRRLTFPNPKLIGKIEGNPFIILKSANTIDFSHCLRPLYTEWLIKELIERRNSLNIVGNKGSGRKRLLDDIQHCNIFGVKVANIDFKEFRMSHSGLLREIRIQLGLSSTVDNLAHLFDQIATQNNQLYLIMLHNFDALVEYKDIDKAYTNDFIATLNNLKNRDHIVLVSTAKSTLKQLQFNGQTSLFTLPNENLDNIFTEEVKAELQRQLPNHTLWQDDSKYAQQAIITNIKEHTELYTRLETIRRKLSRFPIIDNEKIDQQLKSW